VAGALQNHRGWTADIVYPHAMTRTRVSAIDSQSGTYMASSSLTGSDEGNVVTNGRAQRRSVATQGPALRSRLMGPSATIATAMRSKGGTANGGPCVFFAVVRRL
jgi:hypothetical protein